MKNIDQLDKIKTLELIKKMVGIENKDMEKALGSYEKLRLALSGLYEILHINMCENDFYYKAGADNLKAINEEIIEILKSAFGAREIRMKLRELEFNEKEMAENFPF
ncbi:MAG: hypothetical protein ACTSR8_11800 [Promethearchaeota archaeon]